MQYHGVVLHHDQWPHVPTCGCEWDYDGQRYIDEVLLPHVRLFRGAVGDKFVFMDDNATCHRTLAVQDCLDNESIQRLVWPARSPDLNPIEMCGDALGGKLLVETILRQTRTPSSMHSQRNGINCLNSCWIISKKIDLIQLARDLDESPDPSMSKIVLRNLIISSKYYKEEEAKELLEVITAERLETEQRQKLEQQEQLSIEKLRLEMELSRIANQSATQNNGQTSRVKSLDEIVKMVRLLTVKVPNKSDGWEYFFSSLEKAFASEMVSDELKPKVLLCMLGDKVSNLLVNLGEEELKDYESLKQVVLKEYEPSPPKNMFRKF
ncbi:retrovirus-related Pol polyprotein from transposon opus [Trichonephila clavipes]|nr:retrovirus-related Pol polyprotein from transposon opus [Trichonephila clavipes]